MRNVAVWLAVAMLAGGLTASGIILTFDDITPVPRPTSTDNSIPDGYGGLEWEMMYVLAGRQMLPETGYDFGTVSGDWVAYNAFDYLAVASDNNFDFNSAWLTSAWEEAQEVEIKGYRNNILKYAQLFTINNQGPIYYEINYLDVDRVEFNTPHGTQFVMDNMEINRASIPDGGISALLLVGALSALKGARRLFELS